MRRATGVVDAVVSAAVAVVLAAGAGAGGGVAEGVVADCAYSRPVVSAVPVVLAAVVAVTALAAVVDVDVVVAVGDGKNRWSQATGAVQARLKGGCSRSQGQCQCQRLRLFVGREAVGMAKLQVVKGAVLRRRVSGVAAAVVASEAGADAGERPAVVAAAAARAGCAAIYCCVCRCGRRRASLCCFDLFSPCALVRLLFWFPAPVGRQRNSVAGRRQTKRERTNRLLQAQENASKPEREGEGKIKDEQNS